jgi:hypothetical protein
MKHTLASLTIGACVLLSSAGAVFATTNSNVTGQPGAASGPLNTCGNNFGPYTPGQAASAPGSPFNTSSTAKPKEYAGNPGSPTANTPPPPGEPMYNGNANTTTAISEYDVACRNQQTRILGK